jgi:uncharacterized protein YhfF
MPLRADLASLKTWGFADPGPLRDQLTAAALSGAKTTTASLLADVDDQHAIDEGEGYANAAEFRVDHEGYWNSYIDQVRAHLGDPTFVLGDDTPIVLERFRIVERLDPDEAG